MNKRIIRLSGMTVALALFASCGGGDEAPDGMSTTQSMPACVADRPCVSTVAGTGEMGNANGPRASAQFWYPHAVAVDGMGAVHVADYGNSNLNRKIAPDGTVTTPETDEVEFASPAETAIDRAGNQYVADRYRNRILMVTPAGITTVLVGQRSCSSIDGDASVAGFCLPSGLALDADGNLYVADAGNARIRKITLPNGAAHDNMALSQRTF